MPVIIVIVIVVVVVVVVVVIVIIIITVKLQKCLVFKQWVCAVLLSRLPLKVRTLVFVASTIQ